MVTQAPKKSAVAIAVAFTLSCVGLIIFVWTQFGGSVPFAPQGYRVKALFNETGLLVPGADIRIAGVNVGRVANVQAQGTHSLVTLNLSQQFAPIPRDTRAILREKTLLGEAYIELSPGNPKSGALPDGGTIPPGHVAATWQLDQVLNSFTPPVQHDLQAFLEGTGSALSGRGQDINDAFGNFAPAMTQLQQIVGELDSQKGNLQSLVNNSATVLTTLGDRGSELQNLVTSGNSVLSATAAQDTQLEATVNAMPAFLTQLKTTLGKVNTTLDIAKPSLNALAPVTPLLKPALQGLTTLSGPLVDLLKKAPPVLKDSEVALPYLTKFIAALGPTANALVPAAEQIIPMIDIVADYRQDLVTAMAELPASLNATVSADTTSDALGLPAGQAKALRALVTIGPDSVFGQGNRNAAVRSNTYFSPGELSYLNKGGLFSAACPSNATSGNVPCKLQPSFAWGHGIATSYYPHVTAAKP